MSQVDPAQQTQQITPESGLRYDRIHFVRENVYAETPADPAWLRFSDLVMEISGEPDPGKDAVHSVGTGDPVYFGRGMEENTMTVSYGLQKAIVDSAGEPNDASADAFLRNQAWQPPNTHSVVARHNNPTKGMDDAADVEGQRLYFVGRGGKANATLEPDAEDEEPVPVELEYTFNRIRTFHIWQPATPTNLAIDSTDTRDTGVTVTIESEPDDTGTVTSTTLTLDGTTLVGDDTSFADIDAINLSEPIYGDLNLYINDGDTTGGHVAGTRLALLRGADARAQGTAVSPNDGDIGVPGVGAGSYEGAVGLEFEDIQSHTLDFPFPPDAPVPEVFNISLEVDNGHESNPQQGTNSPAVNEENRSIEIEQSVVGERASHDLLQTAYTSEQGDIIWELSRTRITLPGAECTEPPGPGAESEQAYVEIEGTWMSQGIVLENTEGV